MNKSNNKNQMLIKLAINGARTKEESKYIPHSLNEIENEVRLLYENGNSTFHIHCYDKNGNESLKPCDVNALVSLVKNISPSIQIGISSGEWIEPDFEKRKNYINEWEILPDFVSVNMIEADAIEISKALISKGVKIEAGLNEKKATEIFAQSGLAKFSCRVLIEPEEEDFDSAINTINKIEKVLDKNKITLPRLLHGFNELSWKLLKEARERNYDGRIGMEDTIYLPNGEIVKSNLDLINSARKLLHN